MHAPVIRYNKKPKRSYFSLKQATVGACSQLSMLGIFLSLYTRLQKTRAQYLTESGFREAKISAVSEYAHETGHFGTR